MRHRAVLALLIGAVAVLVGTTSASGGGKPTRTLTANVPFTLDAGFGCTFPTSYQPLVNHETTTTFPTDVEIDGHRLRLTNLDNGKSVTVNISGPATITLHPDGSVSALGGGVSAFPFGPTDTPAGPHWWLFTGRLDLTQTATGSLILNGIQGKQEDLCPQIA